MAKTFKVLFGDGRPTKEYCGISPLKGIINLEKLKGLIIIAWCEGEAELWHTEDGCEHVLMQYYHDKGPLPPMTFQFLTTDGR